MNTNQCEQCGKKLPADAPNGSCPNCLLGLAMNNPAANATAAHLSDQEFAPPRADQLVGKFPNLEIQHLLGHGGMGAVYQARQTNLDRTVALKILSPRLGSDPTFAERFMREAKTLAKLAHPNIVMVFDFGQTDDMYYLVMEFVDGINLREAIFAERLSPKRALEIIPQVCDALQYAHDHGVIHRDIKPENILIDKKGAIKIADFGLAKLQSASTDLALTGTRQILGTASYMAPEQIEKPNNVDHRADIYSLGVVFYELLTGELPIGRFSVPSEKSSVSNKLDDVVMRTLEKEPSKRYQQASQVRTAVETADVELVAAESSQPSLRSEKQQPTTVPLPFKLSEINGGFNEALGIARGFAEDLELEFEVKDAFGVTKSKPKRALIPFEHLASVRFKPGIFYDKIEIQANRIDAVQDVPNANQGRFKMVTKKVDRRLAQQFTHELAAQLPHQATFPVAPTKMGNRETADNSLEEEYVIVTERLTVPRLGLVLASALHLLFAFIVLLLFTPWFSELRTEIATSIAPSTYSVVDGVYVDRVTSENVLIVNIIAAVMAVASTLAVPLFLLATRNIRLKLNFHATVAILLLALVPFHPIAFVSIPFAIWGLIVMFLPSSRRVFRAEAFAVARGEDQDLKSDAFDDEMSKEMMVRTARAAMLFVFLFFCVALVTVLLVYANYGNSQDERPMQTVTPTQQTFESN